MIPKLMGFLALILSFQSFKAPFLRHSYASIIPIVTLFPGGFKGNIIHHQSTPPCDSLYGLCHIRKCQNINTALADNTIVCVTCNCQIHLLVRCWFLSRWRDNIFRDTEPTRQLGGLYRHCGGGRGRSLPGPLDVPGSNPDKWMFRLFLVLNWIMPVMPNIHSIVHMYLHIIYSKHNVLHNWYTYWTKGKL